MVLHNQTGTREVGTSLAVPSLHRGRRGWGGVNGGSAHPVWTLAVRERSPYLRVHASSLHMVA